MTLQNQRLVLLTQLLFIYDMALVAESAGRLHCLIRKFGMTYERINLRANGEKIKFMQSERKGLHAGWKLNFSNLSEHLGS